MNQLILLKPTQAYAKQVMDYKKEMIENKDTLDGCAALEDVDSFEEWVDFDRRLKAKYKDGYVPSDVYLAVRIEDDVLVGILDFRHPLSDFLKQYGGNIGYSIRPKERRKGYANEMLGLALPICKAAGEVKVLLTCDKDNIASSKTIQHNGGILENEVSIVEDFGKAFGKATIIQRYWIHL